MLEPKYRKKFKLNNYDEYDTSALEGSVYDVVVDRVIKECENYASVSPTLASVAQTDVEYLSVFWSRLR